MPNKIPVSVNETKVKKITKKYSPAELKAFHAGVNYALVALLNESVNSADIIISNAKIYTKK